MACQRHCGGDDEGAKGGPEWSPDRPILPEGHNEGLDIPPFGPLLGPLIEGLWRVSARVSSSSPSHPEYPHYAPLGYPGDDGDGHEGHEGAQMGSRWGPFRGHLGPQKGSFEGPNARFRCRYCGAKCLCLRRPSADAKWAKMTPFGS